MHQPLKHLGLTQLEKALPTLLETARQEPDEYTTADVIDYLNKL